MKRVRLTESQLHRVINESVKNILMTEGLWDKTKGAFKGMTQGFQKGQEQMDSDNRRNDRNENDSKYLTYAALQAYKILARCNHGDERSMSNVISQAEKYLMQGLKNNGFGGFSDGSGTSWKDVYKPLYNKTNGYDGSVNPSFGD